MGMHPRAATDVVLALLLAGLISCGNSRPVEDEIAEVIRTAATSSDPADCTRLATQRFLEQSYFARGDAAVKTCRQLAKETADDPDSVAVSHTEVRGARATARATFQGGFLDGQALNLSLVEQDDQWKLDHTDSFARFDRRRYLTASEKALARFRTPRQTVSCMIGRVDRLSDTAIQRVQLSGDPERLAAVLGPCVVAFIKRELARRPGVPQRLVECVVRQIDKPPYTVIQRLVAGEDVDRLFQTVTQACLTEQAA